MECRIKPARRTDVKNSVGEAIKKAQEDHRKALTDAIRNLEKEVV